MNLSEISAPQFLQWVGVHNAAPSLAPVLHRLPAPPVAPHIARMTPAECREHLRRLKDDAVHRSSNGRWSDAEAREWSTLHISIRMSVLLLAGIEGELEELGRREWRELPPPERNAIKAQIRYMADEMAKLHSLTVKN